MKRVSLKVAKYLKEVGYLFSYEVNENFKEYFPTYLDVWLWLWKVKDIKLSVAEIDDVVKVYIRGSKPLISQFSADPEGAIINIIEFLVDNDLIK